MGTLGTILLATLAIAAMVRSFTLQLRYLQDGICYLRGGRMVMDWAMPGQGLAVAAIAVVATLIVLRVDPAYPHGAGVLLLTILDAAGAMGLLLTPMFLMSRSDMARRIEYHQPLFMPDRSPGCASTRHVTVHVVGRGTPRRPVHRLR